MLLAKRKSAGQTTWDQYAERDIPQETAGIRAPSFNQQNDCFLAAPPQRAAAPVPSQKYDGGVHPSRAETTLLRAECRSAAGREQHVPNEEKK